MPSRRSPEPQPPGAETRSRTRPATTSFFRSTGYGRRFIAERPTRIGLVPIGYADGFPRALRGAEVLVDGVRRPVVGTPSMDSFAVAIGDAVEGATVTIIGDGLQAEEHARTLGTINYEIVCGIGKDPARCDRVIVDG